MRRSRHDGEVAGLAVDPLHHLAVAPRDSFWERHLQNTGQTREEALRMLRRLLGTKAR